jgi:hypothetical protein
LDGGYIELGMQRCPAKSNHAKRGVQGRKQRDRVRELLTTNEKHVAAFSEAKHTLWLYLLVL